MKGLLVKDFRLMQQRKRFFLMMFIIAICLTFNTDGNFVVSYLTFIGAMFGMSTISYDEFDNCYPFLLSLPLSRQTYVKEKYLFGFLVGLGAWLAGTLLAVGYGIVKIPEFAVAEGIMTYLLYIPLAMLMLALVIPFQLKYGAERGRMVMIGVFGGVLALGYLFLWGLKRLGINLEETLNRLNSLDITLAQAAIFAVAAVVTAVSMAASFRIMKKKEF